MSNKVKTLVAGTKGSAPQEVRSNFELQKKVSIIGAGPAGFALAADLKSHGIEVLVYSHPDHFRRASEVITKGQLNMQGKIQGTIELRITSNMADALAFSKTIILTVPSTGHQTILQEFRQFSLRQHTVIAVPGNLFSMIAGIEIGCVLETNLSPYSCRMDGNQLLVLGKKRLICIAALQKSMEPVVRDFIQSLFSTQLKWCSSVVEVCLLNVNAIFHPLMMLMNAGRIENTKGDFRFYRDGLTPSVATAMEALDKVRIQIGQVLGLDMKTALQVSNECYGHTFTDLVDLAQNSAPHNKLRAPFDLENRNITEDIPDLLVCWLGLAEKLGIDASPIKAVITLAEMATGRNYCKSGRNIERLQLKNISRDELIQRFGPCHG